jgi:hypothetical protein
MMAMRGGIAEGGGWGRGMGGIALRLGDSSRHTTPFFLKKKKKKELCGEAKGRERCLRETRMQYTLNV